MSEIARDYRLTVLVAMLAMVSCGPGSAPSQEYGRSEATGFGSHLRNELPAPAVAILEQADGFELLALNPSRKLKAVKGTFHGYRILGTTFIKDAETRKKLVSAFEKGVAENQGVVAACFNPRHGIRATRNRKQADFVVCFECDQVQLFGETQGEFLISSTPRALFDSVLRSSGVLLGDR